MKKSFIIFAPLCLFSVDAQAIEISIPKVIEYHLTAPEEIASVESFLGGRLCPSIAEYYGIACPAARIKADGVRIAWDEDGSIHFRVYIGMPGVAVALGSEKVIDIVIPKVFDVHITAPAEIVQVESFLGARLCPVVKSEYGIANCPAALIRVNGVRVRWEEDASIKMLSNINLRGNGTATEPE